MVVEGGCMQIFIIVDELQPGFISKNCKIYCLLAFTATVMGKISSFTAPFFY